MSSQLDRLKALADEISSYEIDRKKNLKRLRALFGKLELSDKVATFEELFDFKAINLSGITLASSNLGKITEGRYAQIIAIAYIQAENKKRAKNISLGYFGRVEQLDESLKKEIVEFILRWRLEKSFIGVDHYRTLIARCAEI